MVRHERGFSERTDGGKCLVPVFERHGKVRIPVPPIVPTFLPD